MKEALKLALEALQLVSIEFVCNGAHHAKKDRHDWLESCPIVERYQAAITAIKEALAQPDYRAVKTYHEGKPVYVSQPEQEPVATMKMLHTYGDTTPPKRPWVGLTNEDMYELGEFANTHGYVPTPAKRMFAKIEAKLKEKNFD